MGNPAEKTTVPASMGIVSDSPRKVNIPSCLLPERVGAQSSLYRAVQTQKCRLPSTCTHIHQATSRSLATHRRKPAAQSEFSRFWCMRQPDRKTRVQPANPLHQKCF